MLLNTVAVIFLCLVTTGHSTDKVIVSNLSSRTLTQRDGANSRTFGSDIGSLISTSLVFATGNEKGLGVAKAPGSIGSLNRPQAINFARPAPGYIYGRRPGSLIQPGLGLDSFGNAVTRPNPNKPVGFNVNLIRPGIGGNFNRPVNFGGNFNTPGNFGENFNRPGSFEGNFNRPGNWGGNFNRPGSFGGNINRPGHFGGNLNMPGGFGGNFPQKGLWDSNKPNAAVYINFGSKGLTATLDTGAAKSPGKLAYFSKGH